MKIDLPSKKPDQTKSNQKETADRVDLFLPHPANGLLPTKPQPKIDIALYHSNVMEAETNTHTRT